MINTSIHSRKPELPDFELPNGFDSSDEYLRHLVMLGLEKKYPDKVNTVIKQAEHELEIIKQLGYTDYFLIIADIIAWARKQGIPVGSGRGSAPSSLIAYALDITSIDPFKYDLVFERFVNLEYPAIPDIDTDFSAIFRDEVVNYVVEKYGKNRVGQISVYSNDAKESCIHATGIVISKKNLDEYGDVYLNQKNDILVTKYSTDELEKHGLVKIDFLGLKTLDTIYDNERTICERENEYADFSINDIPLNDKATFNLFCEGRTIGIFQFESGGIREFLQKLKPDCLEHLIALSALYRPGPMALIPEYIERKAECKPVEYPHPCLEDILKETYGLIIYQEQVIQIIHRIAGYSLGEADVLRRHLQKNNIDEKSRFIISAANQGFKEEEANNIFDILVPHSSYAFNKSHAVSYALLAYQTAYLKANF